MVVEVIIVRHSERFDDIDKEEWVRRSGAYKGKRDRFCYNRDPPITANGVQLAIDASVTVKNMLQEKYPHLQPVIFASKMTRTVQTAHQIALALDLPVHLCSGLTKIVPGLFSKKTGTFDFMSIKEMREICSGVEFQDCDVSTAHYKISTDSSDSALETIANIPGIIPIIVAHRETIRRLAGEHVLTPYCCIALYRFLSDKINSSVIVDGTATQLEQSLKISGSTTVVARSGNSMVKVVSTSQNGSERKSGKRGISVDYANFKDTSQFLLLQLHDRNGNVIETSTTR